MKILCKKCGMPISIYNKTGECWSHDKETPHFGGKEEIDIDNPLSVFIPKFKSLTKLSYTKKWIFMR